LPSDHPHIATSMNNLAMTYSALGRHQDALQLQEDVLAFRKRVLPSDHLDIATSMGNLASTYSDLGRHQDALQLKEDVLAFRKRVLPSDHPDIATSMGNLASTYSDLGRHQDALQLDEDVLAFQKRVLPSDHPDIATSMSNLARTYFTMGNVCAAELALKDAVGVLVRARYDQGHPFMEQFKRDLANIRKLMHGNDQGASCATAPKKARVKPNAPCHCGSAMKFKKCCGRATSATPALQ
jgi:tetratricopeptide (TPR) repeat protein